MSTRTGYRKSGLMDRLRRLRSNSIPPNNTRQSDDTASSSAEKPPLYSSSLSQRRSSWMPKPKLTAKNKQQSQEGDQVLDLEKLDSKLEQWARERKLEEDSEEEHDEHTTGSPQFDQTDGSKRDEQERDQILAAQSNNDEVAGGPPEDQALQRAPENAREPDNPSIPSNDAHPEQQPPPPSDFDVFLRKAEEEERLRQEKGGLEGGRTKTRHEQPLNQFYVNHSWVADQGRNAALPPPHAGTNKPNKLSGIRELVENQEEEADPNTTHARAAAAAAAMTGGKPEDEYHDSSSEVLSTATASTGSHDFADPITLQYTATTQTNNTSSRPNNNRVGRHVSFTEPPTTIIPPSSMMRMRERSASYPVAKPHRRRAAATGQVRFGSPRRIGSSSSLATGGRKTGIGRIFAGFGR